MPHEPSDPFCLERKNMYRTIHCFSCQEDEEFRFGVGFNRAWLICPSCYHVYATPADLEHLDYEARANAAGHPVDKREPNDIDRCPLCTNKFLTV
jgi:hypothetical protein